MGPRRWSRGRDLRSGSCSADRACFNGATAMEPWKRSPELAEKALHGLLQWGHGDGAVEEQDQSGHSDDICIRFNGATAMEPWKRVMRSRPCRFAKSLQWGHGDGAVEEKAIRQSMTPVLVASMGPRPMEPWKSDDRPERALKSSMLQWGHGRWSRGRALARSGPA